MVRTESCHDSLAVGHPLRPLESEPWIDPCLRKNADGGGLRIPDSQTGMFLVLHIGRQPAAVERPLRRPTGDALRERRFCFACRGVYQHDPTAIQVRRYAFGSAHDLARGAAALVVLDRDGEPAAVR